MSRLTMPLDVMLFELRRSLTVGRMAMWVLLVAFPIAILTVVCSVARSRGFHLERPQEYAESMGFIVYFLIPEVTCLLGLLLWATPAISTEIEGQTWIYLALRRSGRSMVLIGKYLTAVLWTLSAALVSITVCMWLIDAADTFRLWGVMSGLAALSCMAHAAIFLLIGTIFYRRTMVTAVFYTMVVEYGFSFVPALVNKITINYRLRGLLAEGMQWENVRSAAENIFGSESATTHFIALMLITMILLGIALYRVERGEFPTQQET